MTFLLIFVSSLSFYLQQIASKTIEINVVTDVLEMIFTPFTYDSYFHTGTNTIGVHRQLLSSVCPRFATLFASGSEHTFEDMGIGHVSSASFKSFLKYFYRGRVQVNSHNITEMMELATRFCVAKVLNGCIDLLRELLDVDSAGNTLQLAMKYNLPTLTDECINYIREHTRDCLLSEKLVECEANTLYKMLESDERNCSEAFVFDRCIEWAKAKCEQKGLATSGPNIRYELGACSGIIDYSKMSYEELESTIEDYSYVFTYDEIANIRSILVRELHENPCNCHMVDAELPPYADDATTIVQDMKEEPAIVPEPFDCYFRVGNERVGAHRETLSEHSDLLAAYLILNQYDEIPIDDVSLHGFMAFLSFFYYGRVELTRDTVAEVLHLAQKYEIEAILTMCATFLNENLNDQNGVQTLELATYYGLNELRSTCNQFLRELNIEMEEPE